MCQQCQHTVYNNLIHMGLSRRGQVKGPKMTPVHQGAYNSSELTYTMEDDLV